MIVITAPTGRIGSQLLPELLKASEPIRVIVRDPSRLSAEVLDGVEIVTGSHADAAVVDEAFAGADAVFWLVPGDPTALDAHTAYVDFSRPGIEALKRHRVSHVVGISALGRGTAVQGRAGHVTATLELDDQITAAVANYRALTMPGFMDNLLGQAASIAGEGVIRWPSDGDAEQPMCATGDIAHAAARLLLDRSWSGDGHLGVLGPQDISLNQIALIASEVLGRPVRFEQTPLDAFRQRMIGVGMSEGMAQAMADMIQAKNEGLDHGEQRTAESTTPTSFRQWCTDVLRPAVLAAETI